MKHWFKDQHLRSLLKNSSYLAVSRVVAAIAGIATVSLAAHGLGVLMFGALILITSYAKAVSGMSKFQSWQLIVRYGGRALHGNPDDFKTSTGFAFALDAISGVGGMLVAAALLPFSPSWVGITPDQLWLAMLYCTLLPTMGAATPERRASRARPVRSDQLAGTVTPITRAILVAIAYASGAPFAAYVAIWFVTDLAGDLYPWFLAWRELRRNGLMEGIRPTLAAEPARRMAVRHRRQPCRQRPGCWGPIGRLVVGGLLGPPAPHCSGSPRPWPTAPQKPADLLGKAFYPEVMRMDLTSKKPWKLMLRGTRLSAPSPCLAIAHPAARRQAAGVPAVRQRIPRRLRRR